MSHSQLLSVLHSIDELLDQNTQTDILYLYSPKAFDCMDNDIVIEKLKWYGVTGHLLDWFTDYLRNRYQRVVIDVVRSFSVPTSYFWRTQGSIVGPLLY